MRLSFSTLGCPDWTLTEILEKGRAYGFDGLAFRGLQRELDLAKVPEFQPTQRKDTLARLRVATLKPEMLLASTRLVLPSQELRDAGLQSAREHIDIAADLQVPFVRVFGGPLPDGTTREQARDWAAAGLRSLGAYGLERNVTVLLETHDDFSVTSRLAEVMRATDHPGAGVLWDVHHPFRIGGEKLDDSWAAIAPWVKSVDLKDSVIDAAAKNGFRYVPLGQGDLPLTHAMQILHGVRYDGTLTFEWEKHWHPAIEDAEIAFPAYVQTMQKELKGLAAPA
jgi:sugar phosphate isomerase/epimerase